MTTTSMTNAIERISNESRNTSARNTAREVLALLRGGVSPDDIIIVNDDRWSQIETAMSRSDIESEDTWPEWPAPVDAEDIGILLEEWIKLFNVD